MTALTQSFNSVAMIKYCAPAARVSDFKLKIRNSRCWYTIFDHGNTVKTLCQSSHQENMIYTIYIS